MFVSFVACCCFGGLFVGWGVVGRGGWWGGGGGGQGMHIFHERAWTRQFSGSCWQKTGSVVYASDVTGGMSLSFQI